MVLYCKAVCTHWPVTTAGLYTKQPLNQPVVRSDLNTKTLPKFQQLDSLLHTNIITVVGLQESLRFWWIASGILSFTQYIVISLCPPDSDMLKTMNDSRGQMILSSCCDCFPVWHSSELLEKYGLPSYRTCRAALPLNNYSFEESATCHPFIGLDPSKRWSVTQNINYFDTHETKLPCKYRIHGLPALLAMAKSKHSQRRKFSFARKAAVGSLRRPMILSSSMTILITPHTKVLLREVTIIFIVAHNHFQRNCCRPQ
jgi:hypothetical protein